MVKRRFLSQFAMVSAHLKHTCLKATQRLQLNLFSKNRIYDLKSDQFILISILSPACCHISQNVTFTIVKDFNGYDYFRAVKIHNGLKNSIKVKLQQSEIALLPVIQLHDVKTISYQEKSFICGNETNLRPYRTSNLVKRINSKYPTGLSPPATVFVNRQKLSKRQCG